ncbi:hypothetical protein Mal15_28270 [Stieleria maiorica]|uniref:Thioredoxin domain-containing protein n=2 Tax=Stieleria maiorica TaxID=2795974 RepID=A0A5B9MBU9_9BACT|nr:hypothetical protein Mal15_28270 [Stieleria maiorica]
MFRRDRNRTSVRSAIGVLVLVCLGNSFDSRAADHQVLPGALADRIASVTSDPSGAPIVVVFYARPNCRISALQTPRVKQLAQQWRSRGVSVVAVIPPRPDGKAVESFRVGHEWTDAIEHDVEFQFAERFDCHVVPEVLVFDRQGRLRYRGAVNDRYQLGVQQPEAKHRYLVDAVESLIEGQTIAIEQTEPIGCRLRRPRSGEANRLTYFRDVAPIIGRHCQSCHQPGMSGPFALTSYEEVVDWSEMICEVVDQGLMPPWHANPKYGDFSNANVLSSQQKKILKDWVAGGCVRGTQVSQSTSRQPLVRMESDRWESDRWESDRWEIGEPDAVFTSAEFAVPAEGIVEYQYEVFDPGFKDEKWIAAVEIKASNPAVLHHGAVNLVSPSGNSSIRLSGQAVGTPPSVYPLDTAKRLPPGWKLELIRHYQAIGSEQTDRTSIGLKFIDRRDVKKEVETIAMLDFTLMIPAGVEQHRVEMSTRVREDLLLISMYPHMHYRGRDFRYVATYPDGRQQILLDVPRWDFNWQHRYQLREPVRLPAGTTLTAIAHYDNSSNNPFNPDPNADVYYGPDSTDEMFNAFADIVSADQDMTSLKSRSLAWLGNNGVVMAASILGLLSFAFIGRRIA